MSLSLVTQIGVFILVVVGIGVLVQLFRVLVTTNRFLDEARREVVPGLNKLQTTIEEINTELARVDDIVESVQDVTEKISSTTRVAQEVISSPLIKIASYSFGARRALRSLLRKKG
jgi:predicted PurR-regulated permease PerM